MEIVLPSEILTPAELDVDNQHAQSLTAAGVGVFLTIDNLITVTNVVDNSAGVASDITSNELGVVLNGYRLGVNISGLSAQAQADLTANPYQLFKLQDDYQPLAARNDFDVGAGLDFPTLYNFWGSRKGQAGISRAFLHEMDLATTSSLWGNAHTTSGFEIVAAPGKESINGEPQVGMPYAKIYGYDIPHLLFKDVYVNVWGRKDVKAYNCRIGVDYSGGALNSRWSINDSILTGMRCFINDCIVSINNCNILKDLSIGSSGTKVTASITNSIAPNASKPLINTHQNYYNFGTRTTVSNTLIARSTSLDQFITDGGGNVQGKDFTGAFVVPNDIDSGINQAWADANLVGQGWNGSDILAWAYDVPAQIGAEQDVVTITSEQLTETELVSINQFNVINAIVCEQISESQATDLIQDNQISTVVTEQKNEHSLTAIANINSIASVVCEQLTQSSAIDNTGNQVIYAAHAQQITQALTVNVTSDAAQDINVVVTEQKTQSQAALLDEAQHVQAVITEQLTQVLNTDIEQSLTLNAITTEQLTEAVTVTVDESSGIFVSVVQTEQLTQAASEDIDVTALINAVVTEQLTQCATQQIQVDVNVSAVVTEQLTQAELIAIVESNIANALNIDIDQVTIEILTPKYSIEMLTPKYSIEHIH